MSAAATFLLGLCVSALTTGDLTQALVASWNIVGNGSYGELVVEKIEDGKVTGTIYGQPIVGNFDAASGKLTFTRKLDGNDTRGVQQWSGVLSRVPEELPPRYLLRGTFKAIAIPDFGEEGVEYEWTGQVVRLLSPADDLKNLQGRWRVANVIHGRDQDIILPTELTELTSELEFDGNTLRSDGQSIAVLANDVSAPSLENEIGFRNFRLLVLTLPDGRGLVCSYMVRENGVEIAYPHTTFCHRGSGQVIFLKRPSD